MPGEVPQMLKRVRQDHFGGDCGFPQMLKQVQHDLGGGYRTGCIWQPGGDVQPRPAGK